MSRRKSILGALVLCGLGLCAFGVGNAAAAEKGLTAFTCEEVTPKAGEFTDSHCETPGEGNFSTVAVPENTATEATAQPEGSAILGILIAGIKFEIICAARTGLGGTLKNVTNKGGGMEVLGSGIIVDYSKCLGHAGAKTCPVTGGGNEGTIRTTALKSHTLVSAEVHSATFEPESGSTFTEFTVGSGCGKAFEGTKSVTGTETGTIPAEQPSHLTFSGKAGLHLGGIEVEYTATTSHLTMEPGEHTIGVKTTE